MNKKGASGIFRLIMFMVVAAIVGLIIMNGFGNAYVESVTLFKDYCPCKESAYYATEKNYFQPDPDGDCRLGYSKETLPQEKYVRDAKGDIVKQDKKNNLKCEGAGVKIDCCIKDDY